MVTVLLAFCFLITLPQAVKLLLSKQNLCPVLLISISKYQNKTNIFFSHNLGSRKKHRQRFLSEDTVTFAVHSLYGPNQSSLLVSIQIWIAYVRNKRIYFLIFLKCSLPSSNELERSGEPIFGSLAR